MTNDTVSLTQPVRIICQNTLMNPALSILKSTRGRFASVVYTNAKGETKPYVVRLGVKKHLRGGSKPPVDNAVTVYSISSKGYKTFKAEGIKSVKCGSLIF